MRPCIGVSSFGIRSTELFISDEIYICSVNSCVAVGGKDSCLLS